MNISIKKEIIRKKPEINIDDNWFWTKNGYKVNRTIPALIRENITSNNENSNNTQDSAFKVNYPYIKLIINNERFFDKKSLVA